MLAAGVLDWDEKFELIDGEIVPMNAQNMPHMLWKARLNRWFVEHFPRQFVLVPEGTLRLRDEKPAIAFATDLLIFEPEPGAKAIRPAMVRLAIEVADTSVGRDRDVKAPLYAKYGVAELWIVDVAARRVWTGQVPQPQGYGRIQNTAFSEPVAPLFAPELAVRLQDLE